MLQSNPYFERAVAAAEPQTWIALALLILLAAAVAGLWPARRRRARGPRAWRPDPVRQMARPARTAPATAVPAGPTAMTDAGDLRDQLDTVAEAEYERVRLLNREEAQLLYLLEDVVRALPGGFRLMAQTSLGEIVRPSRAIRSEDLRDRAFRAVNSKRLDFAIFDRGGYLVLAVEYQGSGHYQHRAFMRDAVKREVVRKAGAAWLEVVAEFDRLKVAAQVREILGQQG
jgi:hypothetical protein